MFVYIPKGGANRQNLEVRAEVHGEAVVQGEEQKEAQTGKGERHVHTEEQT